MGDGQRNTERHTNLKKEEVTCAQSIKSECRHEELRIFMFPISTFFVSELLTQHCIHSLGHGDQHIYGFYKHFIIRYIYCHH